MSLFKARDWWSTKANGASDEEEVFDLGCLSVGNIDNNNNKLDKIVVGSFHGVLRIFNPHPPAKNDPDVNTAASGYRADDLLVEQQLGIPILQVECGRFVSGSTKLYLAVLHPRKLAVYSVEAVQAAVDYGSHASVTLQYEHNLQRSSCNMCIGGFGGVKGKDFVCVQSMDATISFFEQESFAFSRFLPSALLPGPLKYVPRTDSIVTVSSLWQLESYKYQILAVATDAKTKEEAQNPTSGKKVTMDWSFIIGEPAVQLEVMDASTVSSNAPSGFLIFILGERNLFCIRDTGALKWMKKFEYNPSCFLPYRMAPLKGGSGSTDGPSTSVMVCTHTTQQLLLFEDKTLEWAASLPHTPVQIRTGHFTDLKGGIVTLSDDGQVQVSYLGTDPSIFMAPPTEAREINYQETDAELMELQKRIKESQRKSFAPSRNGLDELQIIVQVPNKLDEVSMKTLSPESGEPTEEEVPSVTVKVLLKSSIPLEEVKLHIHCQSPLTTTQHQFKVRVRDSAEIPVPFFARGQATPADLQATLTAMYRTSSGAPRISKTKVLLPLRILVKPALPQKTAQHKITIDTNRPPVSLSEIFHDLAIDTGGNTNMIAMQHFSGAIVSVLASKSSQRYRIQSDSFEAIWIVLDEFINRMHKHFGSHGSRGGGAGVDPFRLSFDGPLPLEDYFSLVDTHHQLRTQADHYKELLSQRAQQFRAIQRRLLTRFKDKTPAPLNNLDVLLDGTYRQILALGEAIEENYRMLDLSAAALSAGTKLVTALIRHWVPLDDAAFEILTSALSSEVTDNTELGWEEATDAALTHLLRTSLAKTAKDRTLNPPPLTIPKDTSKLKKHLSLVCDRLGKGAKLSAVSSPGGESGIEGALNEEEEEEEEEEQEDGGEKENNSNKMSMSTTKKGKGGKKKSSGAGGGGVGETGGHGDGGDGRGGGGREGEDGGVTSFPSVPSRGGGGGGGKGLPPIGAKGLPPIKAGAGGGGGRRGREPTDYDDESNGEMV